LSGTGVLSTRNVFVAKTKSQLKAINLGLIERLMKNADPVWNTGKGDEDEDPVVK
jgi:hypothetical protein